MGHNIKPGVATGKEVQAIFNHAKANNYALPAVNVIGSDTINGVLEKPIEENIEICKTYLERMSKMGMTLEIELGITGGEEDGVDNTDVDDSKLYTQPEEVAYAYEELSKVSDQFTVAAAFGNVHGVYKPGNVKLTPKILKNSQEYISKKYGVEHNHIDFVFHGGSGSTVEEIRDKKYYDPRVWLREGEKTFVARLKKAFEDLNNVNTL